MATCIATLSIEWNQAAIFSWKMGKSVRKVNCGWTHRCRRKRLTYSWRQPMFLLEQENSWSMHLKSRTSLSAPSVSRSNSPGEDLLLRISLSTFSSECQQLFSRRSVLEKYWLDSRRHPALWNETEHYLDRTFLFSEDQRKSHDDYVRRWSTEQCPLVPHLPQQRGLTSGLWYLPSGIIDHLLSHHLHAHPEVLVLRSHSDESVHQSFRPSWRMSHHWANAETGTVSGRMAKCLCGYGESGRCVQRSEVQQEAKPSCRQMDRSRSALHHPGFDHSWAIASSTVRRPRDGIFLVCHSLSELGAVLLYRYSFLSFSRSGRSESLLSVVHHLWDCSSTIDDSSWTQLHRAVSSTVKRTQTTAHQSSDSVCALVTPSDHLSDFGVRRCFLSSVVVSLGLFHFFHPICAGLCSLCAPLWLVQETVPNVRQALATAPSSTMRLSRWWNFIYFSEQSI